MSAVVLLCLLYSTYYFVVVVWLFGTKIPTTTTQNLSVISSLLKTDFEFDFVCVVLLLLLLLL